MPQIIKEEPQPHAVIVETNILWHEDKKYVVNPDFDNFWKEQCSNFNLELYVPEVVKGELLFQQSTSAIKARKRVDEYMDKVNLITEKRYRHQIKNEGIKTHVESRFNKWLKSAGGKIIVTPFRRIKWKDLLQAAIWRKPPFEYNEKEKDKEKGFRDAVILETVVDFCNNDTRDISIIFICADELLRETSAKRLSEETRFTSFESTEEFGSYLKLTQEELTNQFIRSILRKASEKFFKRDDPNSLFNQDDLHKIIVEKYRGYFNDPTLSEKVEIGSLWSVGPKYSKWSPSTSGNYWIGRSQYKELENDNIYHWVNIITYVRLFDSEIHPSPVSKILSPTAETKKEEKILILPFHVLWKAKVTRDARFYALEIEDVKLEETEFRPPTEEDIRDYRLEKPEVS